VKPGLEQPIDTAVYEKTVDFFEELMQMLHPFTPFITEEIYHELRVRKEGDDITIKQTSAATSTKTETLQLASLLKEVITALRDARVKNQLKPKDSIKLSIETSQQNSYQTIESILAKQVNAESISYVSSSASVSISFVVQKDKFYIETERGIDTASQKEQFLKDLDYLKGFLLSVEKKLGNERFVQNAKQEVIEIERKKKADAEAKIKAIEESLQAL
jgi:valyl-tRNA synthetase